MTFQVKVFALLEFDDSGWTADDYDSAGDRVIEHMYDTLAPVLGAQVEDLEVS